MTSVEEAQELAREALARTLPSHWRHVRSVARRARWVAARLSLPDCLVVAAWLHDIGYAPELAATGFHPLDGARYLRFIGVDETVVSLVAYHSYAYIEAEVLGQSDVLAAEFSPGDPLLTDVLCYCDITTGLDGDYVQPADQLVAIRGRYGPDHQLTRFLELAVPSFLTTTGRIEQLLAAQ